MEASELLVNSTENKEKNIEKLIEYHQLSKHYYPKGYAPMPEEFDWANRPNPFRYYENAPRINLILDRERPINSADLLFSHGANGNQRRIDQHSLALFLELAMGLSSVKRSSITNNYWYARNNPSSGCLHPIESYVITQKMDGIESGVYHYSPYEHCLEQRANCNINEENKQGFYIAPSIINWRESWKYGERAFRYCHMDLGHAIGSIRFAAAALGWQVKICPEFTDNEISALIGLDRDDDFQDKVRELPQIMLWVSTDDSKPYKTENIMINKWFGKANQISPGMRIWPRIEEVTHLTIKNKRSLANYQTKESIRISSAKIGNNLDAGKLIRQRRSAHIMNKQSIDKDEFIYILANALPDSNNSPFDCWLFEININLFLFVHRVDGLKPGIYALLRNIEDLEDLKSKTHLDFLWEKVEENLPLFLLRAGDVGNLAKILAIGQEIGSDGAFSVAMIGKFEEMINKYGPWAYKMLHWESGLIGQALYLAAEMASVRGTGIGAFFDDETQRVFGFNDLTYQTIYHFTVGKELPNERLSSEDPYSHLI